MRVLRGALRALCSAGQGASSRDVISQLQVRGGVSSLLQTQLLSEFSCIRALATTTTGTTIPKSPLPLQTGRPRLVILGTGWAAARLAKDIDPHLYDFTVISPRNHMVFTPLLSSVCVGTLEPRSVALPIVEIQKALRQVQNYYYVANAVQVDPNRQLVECRDEDGIAFSVEYDKLAIATGSQGSTFGIKGVEQYTHFLRDVSHATSIRSHLIANWGKANVPGRTLEERNRLLNIVVVGGGPTGVEFAGELTDFINSDLRRIDPSRARDTRVTLIEASELLGSFDSRLREYAASKLARQGVHLKKGIVREVRAKELELTTGEVMSYGLCVWSTGVGPTHFTTSLPFAKTQKGRLAVDDCLHVLAHPSREVQPGPSAPDQVELVADGCRPKTQTAELVPLPDVFAMGDCCANVDKPLPALAQVAEQQGKYLARQLNAKARGDEETVRKPFVYRHMGSMATVGQASAVLELGEPRREWLSMAGFSSWVAWRSAYLTRLGNLRNRLYVMMNWTTTLLLGRDVSRW